MANYVTLDDAAKILGVSSEELVEMRSRGEIFGYRDGTSWKFKAEEIDRVRAELAGEVMDEDAGGSSILISEREPAKPGTNSGAGVSDVGVGSDVKLVADPGSGSGIRLVSSNEDSNLNLGSISDLKLSGEPSSGKGSELDLGSDLQLSGGSGDSDLNLMPDSGISLGSDVKPGSSGIGSGGGIGSELELADDDEDELVLGSDSGVGLAAESGINLMSPSDSGLSLEEEPLDLAGTGISGLDLGAEIAGGSGSQSGVGSGISGLGSGALVDFSDGEEFQLTPSGGIEADDDSGSQVIELEDSAEFGGMPAVGGFDGGAVMEGDAAGGGFDDDAAMVATGAVAGAGYRAVPETPYSGFDIALLLSILTIMCICGVLVSDLARNLWGYDGQNGIATGITNALVNAIGRN
ncbi:helix-turn-helix domain-containing protein [Pirellulaceae bacterium SH449]